MWCPTCQADSAVERLADGQRLRCTQCGSPIVAPHRAQPDEPSAQAQPARELLERWSRSDPFGSLDQLYEDPAVSASMTRKAARAESPSTADVPSPPVDHAPIREPVARSSAVADTDASTVADSPTDAPSPASHHVDDEPATIPSPRASTLRLDAGHSPEPTGPHFDVQAAIDERSPRSRHVWMSAVGQWLAYGGVLLMTIGAALVIFAYFGGPARYAPTGWLTTTVGQMLLFLGIVTLVSGGLEQTTEAVVRRIDRLDERILRFEQTSRRSGSPPEPHFPPHSAAGEPAGIAHRKTKATA